MAESSSSAAEPRDWRSRLTEGLERARHGDVEGAKRTLLQALKAARGAGDAAVMLEALIYSARALQEIGETTLARGTFESASKLAARLGDAATTEVAQRALRAIDDGANASTPSAAGGSRAVSNARGEAMPMTIGMYDLERPVAAQSIRTLCHAPFVSVDFGPQGQVTVCNHYHQEMDRLSEEKSFLEIWRGEAYRKLRTAMHDYVIDEDLCRHCARQIRAGDPRQTFALQQYDAHPGQQLDPDYPSLLTFRLSNRCNLACVMCDGSLSSRIRRERDRLPPHESPYGERFFAEMREVLPRVRHIEFFGGEPLLVKEHLRIFEILEETSASASIYINTNGTALNEKTRRYLETLNFRTIAVSMDATIPDVHGRIRVGVKHDVLLRNLEWLLELRERRPIHLLLNVTEQRGNWFDLPELFRFAARIHCPIHINTCIHPAYCSLYTLPTDQLRFVHDYLRRKRASLTSELEVCGNAQSYQHLLNLIGSELAGRADDFQPPPNWLPADPLRAGTNGQLPAPTPGYPPFETPEARLEELRHFSASHPELADRMRRETRAGIETAAVSGA